MKDLLRMLGYSAGAIVVIFLIVQAGSAEIPAGMVIAIALMLVIVVPVVVAIILANRKKKGSE